MYNDHRLFGLPFYFPLAKPNLNVFGGKDPSGDWGVVGAIEAPWVPGTIPNNTMSQSSTFATFSDNGINDGKWSSAIYNPGQANLLSLWKQLWVNSEGTISADAPPTVRFSLVAFKLGTPHDPLAEGASLSNPPTQPIPSVPPSGGLSTIVYYHIIQEHAPPTPGVNITPDYKTFTEPPPLPGPVRDSWGVGLASFDNHDNDTTRDSGFNRPIYRPPDNTFGGSARDTMISPGIVGPGPAIPGITIIVPPGNSQNTKRDSVTPILPPGQFPMAPPASAPIIIPAPTTFNDFTACVGANIPSWLTVTATDTGSQDVNNVTGLTFTIARATGGTTWSGSGDLTGSGIRSISLTMTPAGNFSGTLNRGGVITNFNVTRPNSAIIITCGPPFSVRLFITGTVYVDITTPAILQQTPGSGGA